MKRKIQTAFDHQTPDVLENILSACEEANGELVMNDEKWRSASPNKQRKRPWLAIAMTAAVLALIVGIGFSLWNDKKSVEAEQLTQPTAPQPSTSEFTEDITQPTESIEMIDHVAAMQIALDHAKPEHFWNYEVELVDGHYKLSFFANGYSYFYRIHAETGEIRVSRQNEDPAAADQLKAVNATLNFFEDFSAVTFLCEERDLTAHLAPADMEIWTKTEYFAPYTDIQREEIYLTNQHDYILEFAQYWKNARKDADIHHFAASYAIESVHIEGGFAQVCLLEEKVLHFGRERADSFLTDPYCIMLVEIDGQWVIFDMVCDSEGPDRPAQEQPPLVTEAYSSSYVGWGETTWQQSFPQIMLNSEYAMQINEEIYEWIELYRAWNPGENAEGNTYEYEWFVHGDLLTLLIKNTTTAYEPNDWYTVHTLRISDGGKATREEILAYAGVSEEELAEKAQLLIANTFGTSFGGASMQEMANAIPNEEPTPGNTHLQYIFGKSVCLENIKDATLFLDQDGTLCFLAKIYQFAGADYHERIYCITDKPENSPCYDILMEYAVGREFPIDMYYCYDAASKAFVDAGTTQSEVSDLQCFATYNIAGRSFYKICFTLGDVPHTGYYTVDTCEPIYELT